MIGQNNYPFHPSTRPYSPHAPICLIIGAGGTGGYLLSKLIRYAFLEASKSVKKGNEHLQPIFHIIDGDSVEEKNLVRQHFIKEDLGKNKAEVMASRYSALFGLPIYYSSEYLDKKNCEPLLSSYMNKSYTDRRHFVIFSCVDNNPTRSLISQSLKNTPYTNCYTWWIDAGNESNRGQVTVSSVYNEIPDITCYPGFRVDSGEPHPSEKSCVELAQENPQTILANDIASTLMLAYFQAIVLQKQFTSVQTYYYFNPPDLAVKAVKLNASERLRVDKLFENYKKD